MVSRGVLGLLWNLSPMQACSNRVKLTVLDLWQLLDCCMGHETLLLDIAVCVYVPVYLCVYIYSIHIYIYICLSRSLSFSIYPSIHLSIYVITHTCTHKHS